ncbi:adenylate kinase [Allomyces javanicus]|nr:adenylate kinase [Allomyces javanicus]
MRIYVTGPPLAGKSTVAARLATALNHIHVDPSALVEDVLQRTAHPKHAEWTNLLNSGQGLSANVVHDALVAEASSASVEFRGSIIEVPSTGTAASVGGPLVALAKKSTADTFLVHLVIDPVDLASRAATILWDPATGLRYARHHVVGAPVQQDAPSDAAEGQGQDNEPETGGDKEEGEDDGAADAPEPPDAPVTADVVRSRSLQPISKNVLQRLIPVPAALDDWNRTACDSLSAIVPSCHQLRLDATLSPDALFDDVKVFLELHRCFNPTVPPEVLAGDSVESIQSAHGADDLPRRSLSDWGQFCPVTRYHAKTLVAGSPQFAVGFKEHIYLTVDAAARAQLLDNPLPYVSGPPRLHGLKVAVLGVPGSGKSTLSRRIAATYGVKVVDLGEHLKSLFNTDAAESHPDALVRLALKKLRSGKPLPGDVAVDLIRAAFLPDGTGTDDGWVMDMFPTTREAALRLVEAKLVPDHVLVLRPANADAGGAAGSGEPAELADLAAASAHFEEELVEITKVLEDSGDVKFTTIERQPTADATFTQVRRSIDPFAPKATKIAEPLFEFGNTYDYCPVTLVNRSILRKGDAQFSAEYLGKMYYFVSEAFRQQFLLDPTLFAETARIPPRRLCLLGPQGSGKSTISKVLAGRHGMISVVFSDYIRDLRSKGHDLDDVDPEAPLKGSALDKVMIGLFQDAPYAQRGFILEGFPRFKAEAEALVERGWFPDGFITLRIDPGIIVERLLPVYLKDNPHLESIKAEEGDEDNPIDTLKQDLAATAEKDLAEIDDIVVALETYSLPCVEVNAARCQRVVLNMITTRLAAVLDRRGDMFNRGRELTVDQANELLRLGFKSPSPYGQLCPVSLQEQTMLSPRVFGTHPFMLGNHVYWLKGKRRLQAFADQPSLYLHQERLGPYFPLRIALTGPPLTGKSTLARELSRTLGLPILNLETALELLLNEGNREAAHPLGIVTQLQRQLRSGSALSGQPLAQVMALLMRRCPTGWILETLPAGLDDVAESDLMDAFYEVRGSPDLVIELDAPNAALLERMHQSALPFPEVFYAARAAYDASIHAGTLKRWRGGWDNVVTESADQSKWLIKASVVREVLAFARRQSALLDGIIRGRPAPAYRVHLHRFTTPSGPTKGHCPVSLDMSCYDECPPDWAFSVLYKGVVYHLCSLEHQREFMAHPDKYTAVPYPTDVPMPQPDGAMRVRFPKQFEFLGYCPVSFLNTGVTVDGSPEFCVEFAGKLYAMCDAAAFAEFMRTPVRFARQKLTSKLPVRVAPVPLASLPTTTYLEKAVSNLLNKALEHVGKLRPKLPFMSMSDSAILILALLLKASNPRLKDHVRHKWQRHLQALTESADLVRFLACEMKRQEGKHLKDSERHPDLSGKLETFFARAAENGREAARSTEDLRVNPV